MCSIVVLVSRSWSSGHVVSQLAAASPDVTSLLAELEAGHQPPVLLHWSQLFAGSLHEGLPVKVAAVVCGLFGAHCEAGVCQQLQLLRQLGTKCLQMPLQMLEVLLSARSWKP